MTKLKTYYVNKDFERWYRGDYITVGDFAEHTCESLKEAERNIKQLAKKGVLIEESKEEKKELLSTIGNEPFPDPIRIDADEKFHSPDLLLHVLTEISKTHLQDDAIKLGVFIICCTAYLKPDEMHKSIALKGSSSVGKDNLIKSVFRLFPSNDTIFLTNATQATMEDDISKFRIIAYSEVNLRHDDKGANSNLIEILKQMTEGGVRSLKKDVATGYKTTKESKQDQKTVIFGTTETEDDEELATRFIVGAVDATEDKIRAVNDNTFVWFAGERPDKAKSWVSVGIKYLLRRDEVVLPCARAFVGGTVFDSHDPRSMRDVKRLLSSAAAIAWAHQKMRQTDELGRIIGEPFDILAAIIILGSFFNHTYQGLGDQRLQKYIDTMNDHLDNEMKGETNIFPRHEIQRKMGVSMGTVKRLSKGCQELSIIRFHHTENSVVYYERCQKGVKRVLMGVKWKELMENVFIKGGVKIPPNVLSILEKLDKICNFDKNYSTPGKFDTLNLTPQEESICELAAISGFNRISKTYLPCESCGEKLCYYEDAITGKLYCPVCAEQRATQ